MLSQTEKKDISPDSEEKWDVLFDYLKYIDSETSHSHKGDAQILCYTDEDKDEYFLLIDSWGYSDFIIEFNDWFNTHYANEIKEIDELNRFSYDERFIDYLTNREYGSDDEYTYCDCCNRPIAYKTSSPDFEFINENAYERYCEKCTRENYLEEYINHCIINWETGIPSINIPIYQLSTTTKLKENGFSLEKENLEVGMYGTYDDPVKVLNELTETNHDTDYMCVMTSCNPFATYYEIWKRENKEESEE